jgi:hypothetical protein
MVTLMIAGGLVGCSHLPFTGSDKAQNKFVKTLWTSGEQYVAIEKQDRQPGVEVKPNERISQISVDRLRNALASMDLRLPDREKSIALFNEEELSILSEYIAEGLALAGPDEDVTFAVIGHYVESLGILKKRMVTAGRVFCQDGQINIIFGDVHRVLTETMGVPEDRRLHPFMVGSRGGSVGQQDGILLPKTNGEIFAKMREFWVMFPINGPENTYYAPGSQESGVATPNTQGTVSTPSQVGPRGPDTGMSPPAVNRQIVAPAAKKTVEERLMILDELHKKKLITDEEYRAKRLEILNDL